MNSYDTPTRSRGGSPRRLSRPLAGLILWVVVVAGMALAAGVLLPVGVLARPATWGNLGSAPPPATPTNNSSVVPLVTYPTPIRHVIIVVLENAKASTVWANGPYERHLAQTYVHFTHYYAVCHPSAPNYLAMTSGQPYQCGSDAYHVYNSTNLGDVVGNKGETWGSFVESIPAACATANHYPYAVRHNPFVYYGDVVNNPVRCSSHDLPLSAFQSDVVLNKVPNLSFVVPNLTNDGHDTGVAFADHWLKGWLSPLLNDSFANSSVFFVVYDESVNDNTGYHGLTGGNVYFTAVSPYTKHNITDANNTSHYNLLTTSEWLLGTGNCSHNDSGSTFLPFKSIFHVSHTGHVPPMIPPTFGRPAVAPAVRASSRSLGT